MPSAAVRYRTHSSMIELLLVLRLTGSPDQFLAVPSCSPDGICKARAFGETHRITSDPVSPNAVRCRDIPGAFVTDSDAFGPNAHGLRSEFDFEGKSVTRQVSLKLTAGNVFMNQFFVVHSGPFHGSTGLK